MTAVAGDPSSCSHLGAELRTRAASLVSLRGDLLGDGPTGAAAVARRQRAGGPSAAALLLDRDALDGIAERLDDAGAALQRFAQELALHAEDHRRLADAVRLAGLELDDLRVVEPWGVAAPEVARTRLEALPELRARAERLSGARSRARGALQRVLEEATRALERTASTRRAALGATGPHPRG